MTRLHIVLFYSFTTWQVTISLCAKHDLFIPSVWPPSLQSALLSRNRRNTVRSVTLYSASVRAVNVQMGWISASSHWCFLAKLTFESSFRVLAAQFCTQNSSGFGQQLVWIHMHEYMLIGLVLGAKAAPLTEMCVWIKVSLSGLGLYLLCIDNSSAVISVLCSLLIISLK